MIRHYCDRCGCEIGSSMCPSPYGSGGRLDTRRIVSGLSVKDSNCKEVFPRGVAPCVPKELCIECADGLIEVWQQYMKKGES